MLCAVTWKSQRPDTAGLDVHEDGRLHCFQKGIALRFSFSVQVPVPITMTI